MIQKRREEDGECTERDCRNERENAQGREERGVRSGEWREKSEE